MSLDGYSVPNPKGHQKKEEDNIKQSEKSSLQKECDTLRTKNHKLKEEISELKGTSNLEYSNGYNQALKLYRQADERATRLESQVVDLRIERDEAQECLTDIITKMPLDYLEYYYSNSSQQKEEWAKIIMKAKSLLPIK